jgi:hypothetical protein
MSMSYGIHSIFDGVMQPPSMPIIPRRCFAKTKPCKWRSLKSITCTSCLFETEVPPRRNIGAITIIKWLQILQHEDGVLMRPEAEAKRIQDEKLEGIRASKAVEPRAALE